MLPEHEPPQQAAGATRWRWRRILATLFVVGAFGFLAVAVQRNLAELRGFSWQVRPGILLLSVLLHAGVLFWGVRVWQLLLRRFGERISFLALSRVWFLSSVGRYIPGKIWQFVGVAHLGSTAGLAPLVAVTSLVVQMGLTLVAAILTVVWLLPDSTYAAVGVNSAPLRWLAPLALVLVHPLVIRSALSLAHRYARRPLASWTGTWIDGIWLLSLSVGAWLFYGVAFYTFLAAFVSLNIAEFAAITAINALAFVVGYLVVLAPAGLGAKEGALTALLATLLPLPVAAALALGARLWTIASELLPLLIVARPAVSRKAGEQTSGHNHSQA